MIKGLSEGDRIEFKEILLRAEEQSGRKAGMYGTYAILGMEENIFIQARGFISAEAG